MLRRDAALLQQHADARRDSGLCQLQIAHVRCREIYFRRQIKAAVAVAVARQVTAHGLRRFLRRQQSPAWGDDAEAQQNRRQVKQAGAAQPLRRTAANDVIQKAAVVPHTADGTVHTRHTARDARALEGRAGRHGAADESVALAERHFTVGADVEKQVCARQIRQSGGQQTGRDVPADVARHAGCKVHRHAVQCFGSGCFKERLRPERRRGDAAHGVPGEEMLHDGVAGEYDFVQRVRRAAAARECAGYQRPDLLADALREFLQTVRLLERVLDAADDVGPIGRLRVPAAAGCQLCAGSKVV